MKPMDNRVVKYEDAAEAVSVQGYQCKTCQAFYPHASETSLHSARWCCATDLPCECGKRITNKHFAYCDECLVRRESLRWDGMAQADWDGKAALAIWGGDKYFFDPNDILEYIEATNDNREDDDEEIDLDDLRIVICRRVQPSEFSFADFFRDDMADEHQDDNYSQIDDQVNAILQAAFPETWEPTEIRASRKSIYRHTGQVDPKAPM